MGNRNKPRNRQTTSPELKMDENKPENQGTAADAGVAGDSSAPVADNVGTNDESGSTTGDVQSGAEPSQSSAADSQPESTSADAAKPDAVPPVAEVKDITPPPPVQNVVTPPPSQPAVQAAAAPTVAPVVQTSEVASEGGLTPYADVNRQLAKVPASKHGIIHFLMEYARDMAPRRPIPEQQGATYQVQLYRYLHTLINKEDEHFRELFTAVLAFFKNESERCFAASHAFRFQEHMKLNKDEMLSFNSVMDLLRLLGPVEGRKDAAKQVSLTKALAKNMTDSGRNRVLSYFDGQL